MQESLSVNVGKDISQQQIDLENHLLRRLHHNNLLRVHDVTCYEHTIMLQTEPHTIIDLRRVTERNELLQTFLQLCKALEYLHQERIVHGNLSPAAVLQGYDGCIKLCDYGSVKVTTQPSIYKSEKSNWTTDVFAFGVLMQETLGHSRYRNPFSKSSESKLIDSCLNKRRRSYEKPNFHTIALHIESWIEGKPKML